MLLLYCRLWGGVKGEGKAAMWRVLILQIGMLAETNTDRVTREINVRRTSPKQEGNTYNEASVI